MSSAIFPTNADLFDQSPPAAIVAPWKPRTLDNHEWAQRDYRSVYQWRIQTLAKLRNSPELLADAKAYYATRPVEFISHWLDTFDPRKSSARWMPFILFKRQAEFIEFLQELDADQANGLVEKCRDVGASWLMCAYSVWSFIFRDGDSTGWGSRKQDLVDNIGDPNSLFEKMRLLIARLPDIFRPVGFTPRKHATFMQLSNPENGSTITGESGDNIGRGGRTSRFAHDEAAHSERPEKIEAALGDNTRVQIDISSVNGPNNVFHRKRKNGVDWIPALLRTTPLEKGRTRVFIFDWRHHPEKTQEWYNERRANAEREGMLHLFAQEVDRDYNSARQNRIIPPHHVDAAIDAHLHIPYLRIPPPNSWSAGLDVADMGRDTNALALVQWIIVRRVDEWGERDPGVTARRAIGSLRIHKGIKCQYDSIGMGTNVRSEFNRLVIDEKIIKRGEIDMIPWNAGASVVDPYEYVIPNDDNSPINKDYYENWKAQATFRTAQRFYKTWNARTNGVVYPADELVSIDGTMPNLFQLKDEISQPISKHSSRLKIMVDKLGEGEKSPNLWDSVLMALNPAPEEGAVVIGGMG